MRLTWIAVLAAAAVSSGALLGAAPAQALPPTERTVTDAAEPKAAFDISSMVLRAAPRVGRPAVVVVKHARVVAAGDVIDAWFDLDGDQVPDLHVFGAAYSEYTVHETTSFNRDGRDISARDCVRLSMSGHVSKLRLYPECVGQPVSFAVAVRSSVDGKATSTADWAPLQDRFSKRVLAQPLT